MEIKRKIVEAYFRLKYGFKIRKPIFLLRLFRNYLAIVFLRKQPFKYLEFAFDYSCNLKCEHCFADVFKRPSSARRMKIDDYRRVAKEAMALGAVDFSIQGGEPMLFFERLQDIIKSCQPKKNLIAVATNATLLNEEKITKLKELGVDHLTISLDSGLAEEHDSFRGVKGTFAKAIESIKMAQKLGLNIAINTTVSHLNIHSKGLLKLIDFSSENKILLNTILAAPAGRWKGKEGLLLRREDLEYLAQLRAKNPFIRRDVDSNYMKWGCGAVKEALYISPYGDVLACPFIHISLGNIFEESLAKIRERGLSLPFFKKFSPKCLAAEDETFIKEYLSRTFDKDCLPINFEEGFSDKKTK